MPQEENYDNTYIFQKKNPKPNTKPQAKQNEPRKQEAYPVTIKLPLNGHSVLILIEVSQLIS